MNGLVPSLLVFGFVPPFPISNRTLANQRTRLQAFVDARMEMGSIFTDQKVTRALRAKLPPEVLHNINTDDQVLVFREKPERWLGPYTVSRMDSKRAFISDGKKTDAFLATQILPYTPDRRDVELIRLFRGLAEMQSNPDINITDVFYLSDKRSQTPQCCEAVAKEIK